MDTEKAVITYGKYYRTALEKGGFTDVGQKMDAFESRLPQICELDAKLLILVGNDLAPGEIEA